jgi:hypothetical protein
MSESEDLWLAPNKYNPNDLCPICQEQLGTEQAIYKTPCGHIFHNNCLHDLCEIENGEPRCPVCRRELGYEMCLDVACFKDGCLGPNLINSMPSNVRLIYESQMPFPSQGGKSKSRKRKTNKRKTNKRKIRKSRKNRKTRRYRK